MRKREGIEPRHGYTTVDADVVMFTEGHIKGAQQAMAPANPPGSKTVARQQGRDGNSGDTMRSSSVGVGWHNRHTGRRPDGASEVRCPHMSEDAE